MIIAPKGMKDLLPEQSYQWQFVEKRFRETCARYGFEEVRTPALEYSELFRRSVGDTTDIVQKEMYEFEDHGGRSVTLKPEGTSPAVRAFVEHKLYAGTLPVKMYYITPCFRYEKPQAGRLREFHQFGLEVFGTKDMLADAEVIAFAQDFLTGLGVRNIRLEINSVGCRNCRKKYREALQDYFRPHLSELCETCQSRFEKNPMRILDCKSPEDQNIAAGAPSILDYLCDDCAEAFGSLKKDLDSFGIPYTVNPRIVRGLDYYTKTAFEFVSTGIGAQSTVCGGGRYDDLIEEIGGPEMPGVGFGLGIERLLLLMEENGFEIPKPEPPDAFICVRGEDAKQAGIRIMTDLRRNGLSAEMDTMGRNVKGQFKYAAKRGARYTIVIGDEELAHGTVQLKDMTVHDQKEVSPDEAVRIVSEQAGGSGPAK